MEQSIARGIPLPISWQSEIHWRRDRRPKAAAMLRAIASAMLLTLWLAARPFLRLAASLACILLGLGTALALFGAAMGGTLQSWLDLLLIALAFGTAQAVRNTLRTPLWTGHLGRAAPR